MNFEYEEVKPPLRVLFVNPLTPASNYSIIRILSGIVFGMNQVVDLTLLVFSNELEQAEHLVREMEKCAFACYNTIKISTEMPKVSDADVFIFETAFKNPNIFDFDNVDSLENFDSLYLLLKVAQNLVMPENDEQLVNSENGEEDLLVTRKPIFVSDGLVSMDILHTFSTNIPSEYFFCPAPVAAMARSLLGDYLKILSDKFQNIHIFGANDHEFYFEFEMPLIVGDQFDLEKCGGDIISKKAMENISLDYTQFSPAWLRKDFIEKVKAQSARNLYGPLFKSARYKKILRSIWSFRTKDPSKHYHRSMGVISDGSIDTIKGLPYFLPLSFYGDSWTVNTLFQDNVCVQGEIKRYNKIVEANHKKVFLVTVV